MSLKAKIYCEDFVRANIHQIIVQNLVESFRKTLWKVLKGVNTTTARTALRDITDQTSVGSLNLLAIGRLTKNLNPIELLINLIDYLKGAIIAKRRFVSLVQSGNIHGLLPLLVWLDNLLFSILLSA
jgi:hypothetical protein